MARVCQIGGPNCNKTEPTYGVPGTKKRIACAGCRESGHVNVVNKKCTHCNEVCASYGYVDPDAGHFIKVLCVGCNRMLKMDYSSRKHAAEGPRCQIVGCGQVAECKVYKDVTTITRDYLESPCTHCLDDAVATGLKVMSIQQCSKLLSLLTRTCPYLPVPVVDLPSTRTAQELAAVIENTSAAPRVTAAGKGGWRKEDVLRGSGDGSKGAAEVAEVIRLHEQSATTEVAAQ